MAILIRKEDQNLFGKVQLEGSKSVSNRLLIIQSLSSQPIRLNNLSISDDCKIMSQALNNPNDKINIGAAGTCMRFLTAKFAIGNQTMVLEGSNRMHQRPIKILVEALNSLGAEITYLNNNGFPPLKIKGKQIEGGSIRINADVSSQYISALLMIAPYMKKGLTLTLLGTISSKPYIEMTLKLMEEFGIKSTFENNVIRVFPGEYKGGEAQVESDWSAASYYYSMVALSKDANLFLSELHEDSLQGDAVLSSLYHKLGVHTEFQGNGIRLTKKPRSLKAYNFDFNSCPDLAQTLFVTLAKLDISGKFKGLESLKIKETNRVVALDNELRKIGWKLEENGSVWLLDKIDSVGNAVPKIKTYDDHRMALAFSALAFSENGVIINNPEVVSKSYGNFWGDLAALGFTVELV